MSSKKFAVVGDPISHSLSPVIHRAAYKHLGLDWSYEAKQVSSGQLAFFLDANKGVFSGLSVTMPLKFEAAQLGTTVDNDVRLTAVANTLLIGSNISSFNTDIFGIERALQVVWDTRPQTVAILGSGATARSVLSAFSNKVPDAEVFIYARNLDKAAELADLFSSLQIRIALLESFSGVEALVVNTLPSAASFTNHFESSEAWLLNVGYSQEKSEFSKLFASEKVIRGEEMLIWQAIQQIRIFSTGDKFATLPNETILYEVMKESIQDHATGVGE